MESKQESQPPQARASASPATGNTSQGHVLIASHARIASSAPAATSSVIGPSAAQAITAPRPPKSAADRLRELDLSTLSYRQRIVACGELSRVDHAFSAALRYASAVDVDTPPVEARMLRDCAELARQDAQRIAGEVLVRLGVEP